MDNVSAAWLAGILEGEGWFYSRFRPKLLRSGITAYYPQVSIGINSSDLDVVQKVATIAGAGNVTGPRKKSDSHMGTKPVWMWRIEKKEEVIRILNSIYPHMGIRRKVAIEKCFATYSQKEVS